MKVKPCPADVHVMKLDNGTWIPPLRSWENSVMNIPPPPLSVPSRNEELQMLHNS